MDKPVNAARLGAAAAAHGERAIVLHPELRGSANGHPGSHARTRRDAAARLNEARNLAAAINLHVVGGEVVRTLEPKPATLMGSGAVERLGQLIGEEAVALAIVNAPLTPVQQRNLERAWKCKVIDRTGLILEIFGERARTREGQLQVELAALSYQRSRLVRSWTHLERQRGGFGFLGGPGESQLEIDRRLIDERIVRLKGDLADVKKRRKLQRKARGRVPYPIVALVGYTNAGKSTLFNRLTRAEVLATDMLFATLDPTMRKVRLDSGREIIISDTVGFISDLPTELIAAFHATLEEVLEADLLLHVRDIAHPETEAQKRDVEEVLLKLDPNSVFKENTLEVLNKIDLLEPAAREVVQAQAKREGHPMPLSALCGAGEGALLAEIDKRISIRDIVVKYRVPHAQGKALSWLYNHGEVIARRDDEDFADMTVKIAPEEAERFEKLNQGLRHD